MKKSIGISLLLTIMIILSPITVIGATNLNIDKSNLVISSLFSDPFQVHPINITKMIWDSDVSEWVDYYEAELSERVIFNITITYNKNCLFGVSAEQIQVIDYIPDGLEYEGSINYNESLINSSKIIWNLSEDYGIILYDKECLSILFEADVNEYGLHDNYVEVFAFENGCEWGLFGDSDAIVYGNPPDPSFEKTVKDTMSGEWVKETFQYVTEIVTFKIELIYHGVYNLEDVKIVDYLPDVTYYADKASIEPTYVSNDGRVLWWNLSEFVENGEPLVITFEAYVWGRTGDCPDCGINLCEYSAFENITHKNHEDEDTAGIISELYDDPKLVYSQNNIDFGNKEPGWTGDSSFEIWNGGDLSLTYSISENIDWLEVSPMSGTSEGEHDIITISVVDTIDLVGFYGVNINISSNGGSGSVFVSIFIQEKVPTEPALEISIKHGLCRSIKITIENTGNVELNNISWNLTVNRRGILKRTLLNMNGTVSNLQIGEHLTIQERLFGFGFITVNIDVKAFEIEPFEEILKGFIILRFIRLRRFV
jgi:hypothetical protein